MPRRKTVSGRNTNAKVPRHCLVYWRNSKENLEWSKMSLARGEAKLVWRPDCKRRTSHLREFAFHLRGEEVIDGI